MIKFLTLVSLVFLSFEGFNDDSPIELTWGILADVEYTEEFHETEEAWFFKPWFGDTVKSYDGLDVYITGYMVPVDIDNNYFVLSKYPFAACFFCGNAGPESVVDLKFKNESRIFTQDERLTFTGKLKLNATDVYELNYILEGAIEND